MFVQTAVIWFLFYPFEENIWAFGVLTITIRKLLVADVISSLSTPRSFSQRDCHVYYIEAFHPAFMEKWLKKHVLHRYIIENFKK